MYSYINIKDLVVNKDCRHKLQMLYQHYMKHEYDLLGSGYVKVDYKLEAKGFHGKKYSNRWMRFYGSLVKTRLRGKCSETYDSINWFVDYKSGFFFIPWKYSSQKKCYRVMNEKKGVDIKCPWELGRLYHLLQMAVLAATDATLRNTIILEFKNEITDFIEMNPIGKSVQWSAPMDVSIRMVNMLLAYDILRQCDTQGFMDISFQASFEKHIRETLRFVINHMEYIGRIGTNHYLSNIAGIIFAAAYLEEGKWTDAYLAFGVQELIDQVEKQFYNEGAHFEGSTSYHRLSTEFVLYPMALVFGVLKTERRKAFLKYDNSDVKRLKKIGLQKYDLYSTNFFPQWFIDRVCNAGVFTNIILKDNNEVVQIGDNDSGRLLKLTPMCKTNDVVMEENVLDHRSLLSAMNGIYTNNEFKESAKVLPLESSFIYSLARQEQINGNVFLSTIENWGKDSDMQEKYKHKVKTLLFQDEQDNLLDGVEIYYLDKFGIVVLKGSRLFITMVIDTARNGVYAGHTHNDKLSVEIMVDGKYITRDTGGYVYTASPKIRDQFRSIKAHNTICVGECEQNEFDGMWGMKKRTRVKLLYCSKNKISVKANYGDIECLREVRLTDNEIMIHDFANKPFSVSFHNKMYSDGYGKIKRVR